MALADQGAREGEILVDVDAAPDVDAECVESGDGGEEALEVGADGGEGDALLHGQEGEDEDEEVIVEASEAVLRRAFLLALALVVVRHQASKGAGIDLSLPPSPCLSPEAAAILNAVVGGLNPLPKKYQMI